MGDVKRHFSELENWEILCSFLPPEWAEQARRLGAMRRARYISDPGTVLRILLLHLAAGCSLAETAARASASGWAQISAVGVFKRLRAAEPWLRWLAQQMRGAADLPLAVAGRRLRAVDATAVSEPGSTGTDWKVHWAVNLADLQCDFFELTPVREGGETFRRVPVVAGDILLGDRVYAAPPGVAHVVRAQGDVIVRLNRQALPLFDRQGRRMDLLRFLRKLRGKTPQEQEAQVRNPQGGWIVGRWIALRQSAEATRYAQRRLRRRAQQGKEKVSPESWQFAEYFMLWTTLSPAFNLAQVLEFYRLRWQIELVFKRLKSILGLGHLPKKDPLSAKAWLEGKLFTGLLIEGMVRAAESLSPWGYAVATPSQPVARG
jgi:hypothetical protein